MVGATPVLSDFVGLSMRNPPKQKPNVVEALPSAILVVRGNVKTALGRERIEYGHSLVRSRPRQRFLRSIGWLYDTKR